MTGGNGYLDHSEFTELRKDLGALAGPIARRNAEKAVEHSAAATKARWNAKLYNEGHAKRTGRSITYDVGVAHDLGIATSVLGAIDAGDGSAAIVAEVGPRRGSGVQAGVVLLLEIGSVHNVPHGYGAAALAEEEPDFEARIAFGLWAAHEEHGL